MSEFWRGATIVIAVGRWVWLAPSQVLGLWGSRTDYVITRECKTELDENF